MDKYQWTSTGMSITAVENGPMRYVREVDCDALQAMVNELTAERGNFNTFWACKVHSNHASLRCAICDENKLIELQAKVEELEDMLQSAIERECCNERHIEQLKTRLKASLQECDYCGAALKQEGE